MADSYKLKYPAFCSFYRNFNQYWQTLKTPHVSEIITIHSGKRSRRVSRMLNHISIVISTAHRTQISTRTQVLMSVLKNYLKSIMNNKFTLYVPKLLTTHGNEASRPRATVTLGIGSANLGGSVNPVNRKRKIIFGFLCIY